MIEIAQLIPQTDPNVAIAAAVAARSAQDAASQAQWYALLTLLVQTVGSLGIGWIAYKTAMITASQREARNAIIMLEKNTNSIKDELVKTTKELGESVGKVAGRAELKAEQADDKGKK